MKKLITQSDARKILGISHKKFKELYLVPDEIKENEYCRFKFMYLYDEQTIKDLFRSRVIEKIKKEKQKIET